MIYLVCIFFLQLRQPSRSTLFPYTTLFRSCARVAGLAVALVGPVVEREAAELDRRQQDLAGEEEVVLRIEAMELDRKSTRLNSSHRCISYAVFCLKKKKYKIRLHQPRLYNA